MKDLIFWKKWQFEIRFVYQIALGILALSIVLYYIFYFVGINTSLHWFVSKEFLSKPIILDSFFEAGLPIEVNGSALMIQNIFQVSSFRINVEASYFLLAFWALILSFILATITFLKRLWYASAMGIVLFFLATLQLDMLKVSGSLNAAFYILLLLYLPFSYYFQAFKNPFKFWLRFLVFLSISIGVSFWISLGSSVTDPWVYVLSYASIVPILLTLVFMTMVSHDMLYIFVYLSTQSEAQKGKNTIINFLAISILYLANLALMYMERTRYIDWGITYIEPFWFFPITAILGIWGYKRRNFLIKNILPFEPYGAFIYVALAILSFVTITYYFVTTNDAMIWVFDNFLLYSHLSFGAIFFFYTLINFSPLFQEGMPVYKVAYEGDIFSYKMFRFVGFAVLFIFFMKNIELGFFFTRAGYFTNLGDAALVNQEEVLAEEYYLKAIENDYLNHHARYQFATLAENTSEIPAAIVVLTEALQRNPSPFTYNRLSDLYWRNSSPKLAITTLREAITVHPKSYQLHNNLAMRYASQNKLDSAKYFLEKAKDLGGDGIILLNNQKILLSSEQLKAKEIDSLLSIKPELKNIEGLANWVALFNVFSKEYKTTFNPSPFTDTLLTDDEFVYLYNFTINNLQKEDKSLIKLLQNLLRKEENIYYRNNLVFLLATRLYYKGNTLEAMDLMRSLTNLDTDAYFNRVLGIWFLEQNAYAQAVPHLRKAVGLYDFLAVKYLAIALSGIGEKEKALNAWEQVTAIENGSFKETAQQMIAILQDSSILATDNERYLFIKYGQFYFADNRLMGIWEEIDEPTYVVWAGSELMNYFIENGSIEKAQAINNKIQSIEISQLNELVTSEFYIAYLNLLLAKEAYEKLLTFLKNRPLERPYYLKASYFKAMALQALEKNKEAGRNFQKAYQGLPYDAKIILAFVNHLEKQENNPQRAYEILAESVQVNPFSKDLYQAYALQAVKVGFGFYAESVLPKIKELTSEKEYQAFLQKLATEEKKQEEKLKNFNNQ